MRAHSSNPANQFRASIPAWVAACTANQFRASIPAWVAACTALVPAATGAVRFYVCYVRIFVNKQHGVYNSAVERKFCYSAFKVVLLFGTGGSSKTMPVGTVMPVPNTLSRNIPRPFLTVSRSVIKSAKEKEAPRERGVGERWPHFGMHLNPRPKHHNNINVNLKTPKHQPTSVMSRNATVVTRVQMTPTATVVTRVQMTPSATVVTRVQMTPNEKNQQQNKKPKNNNRRCGAGSVPLGPGPI